MQKTLALCAMVLGGCSGLQLSGLGAADSGDLLASVEDAQIVVDAARTSADAALLGDDAATQAPPTLIDGGPSQRDAAHSFGDAASAEDAPLSPPDAGIGTSTDATTTFTADGSAALPDAESTNDGSVDATPPTCTDACEPFVDGGIDADACEGSPLLVFVTAGLYAGNLGGMAGADSVCQSEANAAGLVGTFRAWISDENGSPSLRFTQAALGYQRLDGVLVAASWTELVTSGPRVAIDVTSGGEVVAPGATEYVWTATASDGTLSSNALNGSTNDCVGWRSNGLLDGSGGAVGDSLSVGGWTMLYTAPFACGDELRIYCMQQ